MLLGAAPGHAANLIVLDGEDPVTLSGTRQYDIVYLDADVQLDGDLNLRAQSVYIGPNATIQTCFIAPNLVNGCGTAARSLTITSETSLSIANPISLRPAEAATGNGGTLTLVGRTVQLGDSVDVSGRGGGVSGTVTIQAQERLDVQGVFARGGAISLVGPDGVRAGEVRADAPDNAQPPFGGALTMTSSRGDVVVRGLVASRGRGAGGVFGGGLPGATTITAGGAVRVGALSVAGGDADASDGTPGGTLVIRAGTAIHVQGAIEAWGGTTEGGAGGAGGVVEFTAKGAVTVANVTADGGGGGVGGAGGRVSITGAEVSAGNILARGGNSAAAAGAGQPGGAGGSIALKADADVVTGDLRVIGGNAASQGGNIGGTGGVVTIDALTADAGDIEARAGASSATAPASAAPGGVGGRVEALGRQGLTVGGRVDTWGTPAAAQGGAVANGGYGGPVSLSAGEGTLRVVGVVRTTGGDATGTGGVGGAGADVTLAGRAVALGAGIVTNGGAGGGNPQGPGGNAGNVSAYTDTDIFDGLVTVSMNGGASVPATQGRQGVSSRGRGPTGATLTGNKLSFTTTGAPVQGYRILRSLPGGQPEVIWQGTTTTDIGLPKPPPCVTVVYTVEAFMAGLQWTSAPTAPVTATRNPAPGQSCTTPARVRLVTPTVRVSEAALRRAGGKMRLRIVTAGVGRLTVSVASGAARTKPILVATGRRSVTVDLPRALWREGRYPIRLVTVAPTGKKTRTTTGTLVVT